MSDKLVTDKLVTGKEEEYIRQIVAAIVHVCVGLPIIALIIGFAVRCFLWAAGFKPFFR